MPADCTPDPFERVVEALTEFAPGDRMKLIIHQDPRSLHRFLERNRDACKTGRKVPSRAIMIWLLTSTNTVDCTKYPRAGARC